jgi:uncharacterized membrane protein YeaQ/YmgE (transglycosylase-associated protein family)
MSGTLGLIVGTIIVGLIAGFLARAIVPGRDNIGILWTILLGIIGSFVGTGVALLLHLTPGKILTWVLTVLGAVIALLIYNRVAGKKTV